MHARHFDRIDWVEWSNRFFNARDLVGKLTVSREMVRLSTYVLVDHTPLAPAERMQALLAVLDMRFTGSLPSLLLEDKSALKHS